MELILGLILLCLPCAFLMFLYLWVFKAHDVLQARIRGENSISKAPALVENYNEQASGGMLKISGYFLDMGMKKIPAYIPIRSTHTLVMGRSGSGKSTLVEGLAAAYMRLNGHNVVILEPHWSLCESLAKWGTHFGKEVTYIDLALATGQVVGWNPLRSENGLDPEETASFLLGCFDDRFGVFGTPQQAEALKAGFILLSENGLTMDYFPKVFYDDLLRGQLLSQCQSDFCKYYFQRYENLSQSQREGRIQAAINKASLVLQDKASRYTLCQTNHSISISEIINNQNSLLLIGLNRGANPTVADLLGSLFLSSLKNAIFQRKPNDKKVPHTHIFCDEFPVFMSPSTGSVLLAESRKYKVDVTFISQFLQVSDPRFKRELLQNTSRQFLFNLESEEAAYFGRKISEEEGARELMGLPPFHGYLIDKDFQENALFTTKPLSAPDIEPKFSNARPVSEVAKELEERKKHPNKLPIPPSQGGNTPSSPSSSGTHQAPPQGQGGSFQNFRNKFKRRSNP